MDSRDRISTDDLAMPRPPHPAAGDTAAGTRSGVAEQRDEPLLELRELDAFRRRWEETQASFVDEPRAAVAGADELVAEVMQRLAQTFARERSGLEGQWDRGDEVSTEDLRIALQRYRSFFDRLLRT